MGNSGPFAGARQPVHSLNAHQKAIRQAAIALRAKGFWPVIIYPPGYVDGKGKTKTGKEPIGPAWGLKQKTVDELNGTLRDFPGASVGICVGPGRGPNGEDLVDVEGDGPRAEESRLKLLSGEIVETLGWLSARGGHGMFIADHDRLGSLLARCGATEGTGNKAGVYKLQDDLPDLEFRIGGCKPDGTVKQLQSVVPPSLTTEGKPREWSTPLGIDQPVAPFPESAYAFLERLAAEKEDARKEPEPEQPKPKTDRMRAKVGGADAETRARAYLFSPGFPASVEGQNGHGALFRAACELVDGFGLTYDQAWPIFVDWNEAHAHPPESRSQVEHKLRDAVDAHPVPSLKRLNAERNGFGGSRNGHGSHGGNGKPPEPPEGKTAAPEPNPTLEVTTKVDKVCDEAVKILGRDARLYSRGQTIAMVIRSADTTAKLHGGIEMRKAAGNPVILTLDEPNIAYLLSQNADLFKWSKDRSGEEVAVSVRPPDWLCRMIIALKQWDGFRELLTVTQTPFVKPDGSIFDSPGYDPDTGTLLLPTFDIDPIVGDPNTEDAVAAIERIYKVVGQFPFESHHDFYVWLAGLLTAIQRPVIAGPVPGFAFRGNKAGCGKGMLIDLIGLLVWGAEVPTFGYPTEVVEAEKTTLSIALAGVPAVHFDNLHEGQFYGSSSLDQALTTTNKGGRILGASKIVHNLPLRPCWFLSGNNVSPGKDAFRRWLPCNLKTPLESPHTRNDLDVKDIKKYVREHRGEIVRDALIILKTFAAGGRPSHEMGPLGSYSSWDEEVRSALHYACGVDCLETQRLATEDSPDRLDKLALVDGWLELMAGQKQEGGFTGEEALKILRRYPDSYEQLRSAVLRLGKNDEMPSARQLGYKLRGMRGENVNGYSFEENGTKHHAVVWKVVTV